MCPSKLKTRVQGRPGSIHPSASQQESAWLDVKTSERSSANRESGNEQEPTVENRAPTKSVLSPRDHLGTQYVGINLDRPE